MGYNWAGFDEIVGVDIEPQKNYPFEFILGDAIEYVREHGHEFDAIHASPPCQAYTKAQVIRDNDHPELIEPTRDALRATGKPYVIENVPFSPLLEPVMMCGAMFPGLRVYRHRLFESNVKLVAPHHPPHVVKITKMGRKPQEGEFMYVVGNFNDVKYARKAMGIDWMRRVELREAIPPAYTEYLGKQILRKIK